jgi:hypothetical protein
VPARRFPPPWSIEEQQACFVLRPPDSRLLNYRFFFVDHRKGTSMKLRRIRLENVRSFLEAAELSIDGDISIVIGPNGGGKRLKKRDVLRNAMSCLVANLGGLRGSPYSGGFGAR